jgi:hypothetical protein
MKILSTGILSHGEPGTSRAILTFPSICILSNGNVIAAWRCGSAKDSSDETIEMCCSRDGGKSWGETFHPFGDTIVDGIKGSLKLTYLTELSPGRILAAAMWADRTSHPGKPLFNSDTEGCLPMAILLAESVDEGQSWSPWRKLDLPDDIGPPSLTSPVRRLPDGKLFCSIETNKHYDDSSKWMQRVVLTHSSDDGTSWDSPVTAGQDPTGRVFNWDQRVGVSPDGRIGTFVWTYDTKTQTYLDIHRRISSDGGYSWSDAQPLGFADQASAPAMLSDGRVVLAWVDRFGTQSIRARLAHDIAGDFTEATEVVIYEHQAETSAVSENTGEALADMGVWSFGLPFADVLPDGSVLVLYYAGTADSIDIHWCSIDPVA